MPNVRQVGAAVTLWVALSSVATAHARFADGIDDPRELEARTLYAAGEYQRALDLFARLYAETLHPTYLRNVGRCHQNLGEPDKAISSFREYLRKTRNLDAAGRAEIEGYIREMEELKRVRGQTSPIPAPAPTLMEPANAAPAATNLATPAPRDRPLPRWLPWAGVALTAGLATAAIVTQLSVNSLKDELKLCDPMNGGGGCADGKVDSLEARENARRALWVLTGAAAVATGVGFYVNYNPQTRQGELSMQVRF